MRSSNANDDRLQLGILSRSGSHSKRMLCEYSKIKKAAPGKAIFSEKILFLKPCLAGKANVREMNSLSQE